MRSATCEVSDDGDFVDASTLYHCGMILGRMVNCLLSIVTGITLPSLCSETTVTASHSIADNTVE